MPIKLAYIHAPGNIVGPTDIKFATNAPVTRKTFYAAGRYWVFYLNSTMMMYRTSTNGLDWTEPTYVIGSIDELVTYDVFYDGTYVHIHCNIWRPGQANTYVPIRTYRRGIPQSDGSISWSTPDWEHPYPAVSGEYYSAATIGVDSDGYPWVGYCYEKSDKSEYGARVSKSALNNGSWSTASGFPVTLCSSSTSEDSSQLVALVPLTNQAVYCIYGTVCHTLKGKLWNGAWGPEEEVTSKLPYWTAMMSATSKPGSDDVHFVYLTQDPYHIIYRKRAGGIWESEVTVQSSTTIYSGPSISIDPETDILYVFWTDSPTLNHIYYKRCINGVWDESPTDWIPETALSHKGYYQSNSQIASSRQTIDGKVCFVYMTGTSSPFYVKFKPSLTDFVVTEVFSDNFDDNSLDQSKWATGSGGSPIGSIGEKNGRLEISLASGQPGQRAQLYIISQQSYSFAKGARFSAYMSWNSSSCREISLYVCRERVTSGDPHQSSEYIAIKLRPWTGWTVVQRFSQGAWNEIYLPTETSPSPGVWELRLDSTTVTVYKDGAEKWKGNHGLTFSVGYLLLGASTDISTEQLRIFDNAKVVDEGGG